MAEYYVNPSLPTNGSGTLQSPFNSVPNKELGGTELAVKKLRITLL